VDSFSLRRHSRPVDHSLYIWTALLILFPTFKGWWPLDSAPRSVGPFALLAPVHGEAIQVQAAPCFVYWYW
jgi:hypothetical protein